MLDSATIQPRYIFLSHNSTDKPEVLKFARQVESHPLARQYKVQIWLDKDSLNNDSGFPRQLVEAIRLHTCAFALYLTASPITPWIRKEIDHAHKRHVDAQKQGRYYPLIPFYAHKQTDSVPLPLELDDLNTRENVFGDVDQVEQIIRQALGLHRQTNHAAEPLPIDDYSATSSGTGKSSVRPGHQHDYDLWLSFVLTREGNDLLAEDDNGQTTRQTLYGLPDTEASAEQLLPLTRLLLDKDWRTLQLVDLKLRLRIMTDDPQLAMLPW